MEYLYGIFLPNILKKNYKKNINHHLFTIMKHIYLCPHTISSIAVHVIYIFKPLTLLPKGFTKIR